jgi:hypothetical protein
MGAGPAYAADLAGAGVAVETAGVGDELHGENGAHAGRAGEGGFDGSSTAAMRSLVTASRGV